jgi:hypothetical protein
MVPVLHLPALPPGPVEPPDPADVAALQAALQAGRVTYDWTWGPVLAMAVKDRASSVHYHPWRTDRMADFVLSYVILGTRYGLLRPPPEAAGRLLAEARGLICPGRLRRLAAGRTVVGRVRLVGAGGTWEDWCGVCWSGGGLAGVEWNWVGPSEDNPE